jgi:hypothetical protein
MTRLGIGLVLLATTPTMGMAQSIEAAVSAAGTAVEVRSVESGNLETYRGFLAGIESRVAWDRVSLRLGYGQGPLDRTYVDFRGRSFVDGFARLDVRVIDGLALGIAGRARAYSTGSPGGPSLLRLALTGDRHEEARRWLLWELHGSYARLVIPDLIGIYADGWWTRPGRINPGETYHGGRGGEVGLEARPAWPPLALRFGYAIDEIRIGSQGRRETVERVTLTIGYTIGGGSREAAAAARTGSSQFD